MKIYNQIIEEAPKNGILYHYTDQAGLIGILSRKEIWASKIFYLNDAKEFEAAIDLARDYITNLQKKYEQDDKYLLILRRILEGIEACPGMNICVCSFSNDGDSLDQWRGYCNGGAGFSIGFKYSQLSDLAKANGFVIGKCLYTDRDHMQFINELVDELMELYEKLPGRKGARELMKYRRTVTERFTNYAPLIKNRKFASEKEWRMISKQLNYDDDRFAFRQGTSMLIPYYRLPLVNDNNDKLIIEKVIVGPCPNKELSKNSVIGLLISKDCRSSHGINLIDYEYPEVEITKIPYRNW